MKTVEIKITKRRYPFYSLFVSPTGDICIGEHTGYRFQYLDTTWFLVEHNKKIWACVEESTGFFASFGQGMEKALESFLKGVKDYGGEEKAKAVIEICRVSFNRNLMPILLSENVQLITNPEHDLTKIDVKDCAGSA